MPTSLNAKSISLKFRNPLFLPLFPLHFPLPKEKRNRKWMEPLIVSFLFSPPSSYQKNEKRTQIFSLVFARSSFFPKWRGEIENEEKLNPFLFHFISTSSGKKQENEKKKHSLIPLFIPSPLLFGEEMGNGRANSFLLISISPSCQKTKPEISHSSPSSFLIFFFRKEGERKIKLFPVLFPLPFENGREKRKRKAGKIPGYRPIVGITDPYCGSYQYIFIISKMQKKIKRNTIIYAISFLYSSFSKKNEGIY